MSVNPKTVTLNIYSVTPSSNYIRVTEGRLRAFCDLVNSAIYPHSHEYLFFNPHNGHCGVDLTNKGYYEKHTLKIDTVGGKVLRVLELGTPLECERTIADWFHDLF